MAKPRYGDHCVVERNPIPQPHFVAGWIEHKHAGPGCPNCGRDELPLRLSMRERQRVTHGYGIDSVDVGLESPVSMTADLRITGNIYVMTCRQNPRLQASGSNYREAWVAIAKKVRAYYKRWPLVKRVKTEASASGPRATRGRGRQALS